MYQQLQHKQQALKLNFRIKAQPGSTVALCTLQIIRPEQPRSMLLSENVCCPIIAITSPRNSLESHEFFVN